jgi:hypothetical protein
MQDTLKDIVPIRNALRIIQSLYKFLEASPKRHAIYKDVQIEGTEFIRTLKSQSARWSCRWEAVKAVYEQLPHVVNVLLTLKNYQIHF